MSYEVRSRCSYYDALAAIGLMKGVPMIDVARDDALISALMEMETSCVRRIVALYDREALGYPTPEKVATLAAPCGSNPARRGGGPEPTRPVHIVSIRRRLLGLFWALVTAVLTSLAVGWITGQPWLNPAALLESRSQPHCGATGTGWEDYDRRARPCEDGNWKRRTRGRRWRGGQR